MNRARLRLPSPQRLPLRGRLTLVTTAVFAVLGCGLLLLNWLSSRQLLEAYRDLVVPAAATTDTVATEAGPPMPGSSAAPAEDAESRVGRSQTRLLTSARWGEPLGSC
ncbi:hypothetical protein [Streptomyces sp. NPDC018352]|uniref:hypothetical protein n=1 Tax=Streptomyces sp. NPDC018352 TaxID=3157194 RepID=UPI0033EEB8B3